MDLRKGEGVKGVKPCPRCTQWCSERYPAGDMLVCGFCYGIGPDGTRSRPPGGELPNDHMEGPP